MFGIVEFLNFCQIFLIYKFIYLYVFIDLCIVRYFKKEKISNEIDRRSYCVYECLRIFNKDLNK